MCSKTLISNKVFTKISSLQKLFQCFNKFTLVQCIGLSVHYNYETIFVLLSNIYFGYDLYIKEFQDIFIWRID